MTDGPILANDILRTPDLELRPPCEGMNMIYSTTPLASGSLPRLLARARAMTFVGTLACLLSACGGQSTSDQSTTESTTVFIDGDGGSGGRSGRITRCESQAELLKAKADQKGGIGSDEYGQHVRKDAECRALKAETFKVRG